LRDREKVRGREKDRKIEESEMRERGRERVSDGERERLRERAIERKREREKEREGQYTGFLLRGESLESGRSSGLYF